MKKIALFFTILVALVMATSVSALVMAQTNSTEESRPDPTGQGRYIEFGKEVSYPNAHVLKQLPAGAQCSPPGEMIGARVWNSTRESFAILSELKDKAEIATASDGRIFLCHCARGFNQLFLTTPVQQSQQSQQNNDELARIEAILLRLEAAKASSQQQPPVVYNTAYASNAGGGGVTPASAYDNTPGNSARNVEEQPSYGCGTATLCQYDDCGQVIAIGSFGHWREVAVMQVCEDRELLVYDQFGFDQHGFDRWGRDHWGWYHPEHDHHQQTNPPATGGTGQPSGGSGSTGSGSGGNTGQPGSGTTGSATRSRSAGGVRSFRPTTGVVRNPGGSGGRSFSGGRGGGGRR